MFSEKTDDIRWALKLLRSRFAKVIWIPGNHELWTTAKDPVQIHGAPRYEYLVNMAANSTSSHPRTRSRCGRETRTGHGRPMFLLYDYSFLPEGARDKEHGLEIARDKKRRRHRRVPTLTAAVCDARRMVPGEDRVHPGAVGCASRRHKNRSREPFPHGPAADGRAHVSGVRTVVRNHRYRRLAREGPTRCARCTGTCTFLEPRTTTGVPLRGSLTLDTRASGVGGDCRRSCASDSSRSGVPAGNAQQWGGHFKFTPDRKPKVERNARRTLRGIAT